MFPQVFGISSYEFMINLGTVVGIVVFIWSFYHRIPSRKVTGFCFLLTLTGVLLSARGSSLLRMLNNLDGRKLSELMAQVVYDPVGNHFLGRVLLALLLCIPAFRILEKWIQKKGKEKIERGTLVQAAADSLSLFFVIQHIGNRLGCLGKGCCYGKPYNGPGAILYQTGIAAEQGITYPVFPSQLFELFLLVLLLGLLLYGYQKGKALLPWFCMGFGGSIFLSEFFMDHKGVWLLFRMDVIQYAALVLTLWGFWQLQKKKGL